MESGVDSDPFIGRRGLMKAAAVGLIAYNSASYIPDVKAQSSSLAEQKWDFETGGVVGSSPTVVEDTVYFGSGDGNLYAVDTSSGEQEWRFETGGAVDSSPTVTDNTVYFGSYDNNLYAVDTSSGEQEWDFETADAVASSPTVVGDTVYVGSGDGNLYAVETSSGELKWSFGTGDFVFSSPTVVDGTVYFGSDNLYAVETGVDGSSEGSRVLQRTLGHHRDSVGSGGRGSLWGAVLAGGAAIAGAVGYGIYRFVGEGEE